VNMMVALDPSWAQALSWTLIHFLWQGAAIGLAAFLVLRAFRLTSAARYAVGIGALILMLAAPLATFAVFLQEASRIPQLLPSSSESGTPTVRIDGESPAFGAPALSEKETPVLPLSRVIPSYLVAVFWLAGVAALSARLLGGWLVAQRILNRAVCPVAPEIHALAHRLTVRFPLRRFVRIIESATVSAPLTIGWLKPVVLLPATALTGLTPDQIVALLAHEFAHIRRHDYLVNLLQSAVETLLFYHPAVWWASSHVRREREHCCDDAAIRICDRLVYATALADLAAAAIQHRVAMAASGGPLLGRVNRILGNPEGAVRGSAGWVPAFVIMLIAGMIAPSALTPAGSVFPEALAPMVQPGIVRGISGTLQNGAIGGVVGGTSAGIAGDSTGGMSRRIPAEITGGVRGDKASGVTGGVGGEGAARVSGGIPAGIAGSIQPQNSGTAAQVSSSQAEEAKRAELKRQYEAMLQKLLERKKEIERQQQEIKLAGEDLQRQAEIEKLQIDLESARARYERIKRRVEVGTATPQALAQTEAEVTMLEQKLVAAKEGGRLKEERGKLAELSAQLQLSLREVERRQQLFATGLVSESALKEAEAKVAALKADLASLQKTLQLREMQVDLERRQDFRQAEIARTERALREIETALQAEQRSIALAQGGGAMGSSGRDRELLASSTPVDAPDATVRAGDLLVIEIAGEPDLPRVFVVADSGSIRLPLIGDVPVAGLTVEKIRGNLVQELTKRKLAGTPQITVSLRRTK
jgi:beta-lactamase regulating signal transducer with metallopeptidase domain